MAVENVTVQIGDSPISFETGKLAKQANGSVLVRSGDTVLVCHRDRVQDIRGLVERLDVEDLKRYV